MFSPCYLWELDETTKRAIWAKYKAPESWSRWHCTYSSRLVKASNCFFFFFTKGDRRRSDKLRSASQPRNLGEASQKWHHPMTSSRCAHMHKTNAAFNRCRLKGKGSNLGWPRRLPSTFTAVITKRHGQTVPRINLAVTTFSWVSSVAPDMPVQYLFLSHRPSSLLADRPVIRRYKS